MKLLLRPLRPVYGASCFEKVPKPDLLGLISVPAAAFLIAILLPAALAPLRAQTAGGVTVRIVPNQLDLSSNPQGQARISITISVPTTPAPQPGARLGAGELRDPIFTIGGIFGGTLTLDPTSPLKPVPPDSLGTFTVPRGAAGSTRAQGEIRYIFTLGPDAVPGEVVVSAQGGQGMYFLGVREQNLPTFRGEGRLMIVGGAGTARPGPPARRPPSNPTDQSVNPSPELIDRLIPILALLGPIALVNWLGTRPKKPLEDPKPKPRTEPAQPPPPNPKKEPVKKSPGDCRLVVTTTVGPHLGDGKEGLPLQVSAVSSNGTKPNFVGPVRWTARVLAPGRSRPDSDGRFKAADLDAGPYQRISRDPAPPSFPSVTAGQATPQEWRVAPVWEWGDVQVEFTVQATVQPRDGDQVIGVPLNLTASTGPITLFGANPEVWVAPAKRDIHATGRNAVELRIEQFLLFHQPAREEMLRILTLAPRPSDGGDATPYSSEAWSHLTRRGNRTFWTPPFLVQEPGYAEFLELGLRCEWTDGTCFKQALTGGAGQPMPLLPAQCDVQIQGCGLESSLEDRSFLPLGGTALKGKVRLTCGGGEQVSDPLGVGAIHSPQAKIVCRVRDLSQGKPTWPAPHHCKLPPRHPCDVDFDRATASGEALLTLRKAKLEEILRDPAKGTDVAMRKIGVNSNGYLFAVNRADLRAAGTDVPLVEFWNYQLRPGEDPIHDGPVVVTVTVDDGLGGKVEVRDAWLVSLGSLLLETGGLDFRVYEHRPFSFEVACAAALPESVHGLSFHWEFALVDEAGNPRHIAGARQTPPRAILPGGGGTPRSDLIVGHLPTTRDIYILQQTDGVPLARADGTAGQVVSTPLDQMPASERTRLSGKGWRRVEPQDRQDSLQLRKGWHTLWHALPRDRRDIVGRIEPALAVLDGKDTADGRSMGWKDSVLLLGVRVELRDGEGHLLATSDRLAPWALAAQAASGMTAGSGGRTPPEFVWRDHNFRFVLLSLRLRLLHDSERRYGRRPFLLGLEGEEPRRLETGPLGQVERLVAPAGDREVEHGRLLLLSSHGEINSQSSLKLGYLDPADTDTGASARLNNLGLFASDIPLEGTYPETQARRFTRAVQRFQYLVGTVTDGALDAATCRSLEEAHDETGFAPGKPERPNARKPDWPSLDPVDNERLEPPRWEDPERPAPVDCLRNRSLTAAFEWPATVRVAGDPWKDDTKRWAVDDPAAPFPARLNNHAKYLVDGRETYHDIVEAIRETNGPDDFVYMLGWCLYPKFELVPGDRNSTLSHLFQEAAGSIDAAWSAWRQAQMFSFEARTSALKAEGPDRVGAVAALEETLHAAANAVSAASFVPLAAAISKGRETAGTAASDALGKLEADRARKAEMEDFYAARAVADAAEESVKNLPATSEDPVAARHFLEARAFAASSRTHANRRETIAAVNDAIAAARSASQHALGSLAPEARRMLHELRNTSDEPVEPLRELLKSAVRIAHDLADLASQRSADAVASAPPADPEATAKAAEARRAADLALVCAQRAGTYDREPEAKLLLEAADAGIALVKRLNPKLRETEELRREAESSQNQPWVNVIRDLLQVPPSELTDYLPYARQIEALAEDLDQKNRVTPLTDFAREEEKRLRQLVDRVEAKTSGANAQATIRLLRQVADAIPRMFDVTHGRRVQIRGIFWQHTSPKLPISPLPTGYQSAFGEQDAELGEISSFTYGAAIQENQTESATGTHHQKVIIIHHRGRLTAYCGGLDVNPDRVYAKEPGSPNENGDTGGPPFHDVHCRVEGPAAHDLLQTFIQRWFHLLLRGLVDERKGPLRGYFVPRPDPMPFGRQMVQVGRTFGVPSKLGMLVPNVHVHPYYFARNGERSSWLIIREAIKKARRFIYVEDQYLTSRDASETILRALQDNPSINHVTILMPRDEHATMADWQGPLRRRFLQPLLDAFPEKVRVYTLVQPARPARDGKPGRPEDWHTYVHNKMWIIDDEFAVIGSANCNVRSYTNDSECVVGVYDPSTDDYCAYRFAHQLRIACWAEHLNMISPEGYAELDDGVASSVLWLHPPDGARIQRYRLSTQMDPPWRMLETEAQAEPRGSGRLPEDLQPEWAQWK